MLKHEKPIKLSLYLVLTIIYCAVLVNLWPRYFQASVSALYMQTWQETKASLSYITIANATLNSNDTSCVIKGRFRYELNNSRLESTSLYAKAFLGSDAAVCNAKKQDIIKANNEGSLLAKLSPGKNHKAFLKQEIDTRQAWVMAILFTTITSALAIGLGIIYKTPCRSLIERLLNRLKTPQAVVIVGTDYSAYELSTQLKKLNAGIQPMFFINEEPWNHKTELNNVALRYPSELLSLVAKHHIKAVIIQTEEEYQHYQQTFAPKLAARGCDIIFHPIGSDSTLIEQSLKKDTFEK